MSQIDRKSAVFMAKVLAIRFPDVIEDEWDLDDTTDTDSDDVVSICAFSNNIQSNI